MIGIVFILISNIFALYPAEFVRHAFDSIEAGMQEDKIELIHVSLKKYGLLIILFSIFKGIFMYLMRQTIIVMSRKIEFDLKNNIYKKYQQQTLSFYKRNNTGDMMNRMTEDVTRVRMYLGPAIMYIINMLFLLSLVILKMLSVNVTLTLYVLIPVPILVITVYYVSNQINKNSEKVQRKLSYLSSLSQESFSAINIIKNFSIEDISFNRFLRNCHEYTQKQLKLVAIEAWFFPLIILLIGISTITTIYIGGMESFKGNVTTGNIAEFIIYVNMLTWPVASVGWVTSIIQRAEASMERINQFLESDVEIINETTENTSIERNIIFKDVSFTYPDTGINALKNINFNINDGETLGIFGRTGSGKSTIAHLICRIYDVDQGEIRFGDTNIKYLNLSDLRRSIGYVPQDGLLFSGTIKENICFGRDKEDKGSIMTSAQIAEISEEIKSFPDQYDTIVGERGVQLSGGQKQRLSIARAIYIDPKIYIFDDALSSVDANKEKSILEKIYNKTQSKINIIISHRTSAIRNATKIIVLDEGKILESGTHEDLISSAGFYAEMHKEQTTNEHK